MDQIIREGDWVRIVVPELFVRCGYPIDLKEFHEKIMREEQEKICDALNLMGCKGRLYGNLGQRQNYTLEKTFKAVSKQVAYCRAKQEGFGGKERRIHTKFDEKFKDKKFIVAGIKMHKTGDYYAPYHGGGGFFDDCEYEPGGLENAKSHKILGLRRQGGVFSFSGEGEFDCRIESIHVEKLHPEDCEEDY